MGERVEVNEKQLSAALAVWLQMVPRQVWEHYIEHKILQHYKRSSLQAERLEGEIARHIAAQMTRLDWRVTHPEATHPGSPPAWRGD